MILDELFERVVQISKTVWRKQGDEISRQQVSRMVASDIKPRSQFAIKDDDDEG